MWKKKKHDKTEEQKYFIDAKCHLTPRSNALMFFTPL